MVINKWRKYFESYNGRLEWGQKFAHNEIELSSKQYSWFIKHSFLFRLIFSHRDTKITELFYHGSFSLPFSTVGVFVSFRKRCVQYNLVISHLQSNFIFHTFQQQN